MTNEELYKKYYDQHIKEGGKMPDASALALLIEHCIKEKSYYVFREVQRDKDNMPLLNKYDVIVVFNFAGDPTFGLYILDDSEDAILMSSDKGLTKKYI